MIKPNGFFFPSVPQETREQATAIEQPSNGEKRSSEEYLDDEVEEGIELYNLLSSLFRVPDEDYVPSKRNNFDASTFSQAEGKGLV